MGKIESSELAKLNEIQSKLVNSFLDLGQLEYSKLKIDDEIEATYIIINNIKKEEEKIKKELNSKYGDVEINMETGEFK